MKEILRKVLGGERDAYRAVVKEYGAVVRAALAAHLSTPDVVEDLAQETFIAAYEHLGDFDPEKDFGAWIKGIARNKLLMHLRRAYQHGSAIEKLRAAAAQEVWEDVGRACERDDRRSFERLRGCFDKLPQRLMDALRARYFEQLSVSAIANRNRSSATAVSSLLFRGRKELQSCMERSP
jgi:RNA polymerase sigma-70 factor (ECF subfamily)